MSVSGVIKAAATRSGISRTELATGLGISAQALSNKYNRESFTADDLIRMAHMIHCRLAFVDEYGEIIEAFRIGDASDPRKGVTPNIVIEEKKKTHPV